MKKLLTSSALFTSTLAILVLLVLGLREGVDVAQYIAMIALGTGGVRAWEAIKAAK